MEWHDSLKNFVLSELGNKGTDYREIINSFNVPIIILNSEYIVIAINSVVEKMIGIKNEILEGDHFINICKLFTKGSAQLIKSALDNKSSFIQEIKNSAQDEYIIDWSHLMAPVVYNQDNIILIGKLITHTSRKNIEEVSLVQFTELVNNSVLNLRNFKKVPADYVNQYEAICQLVHKLPGCSYAKDKEYRYLEGNDYLLGMICGFLTRQDLIGKDDYYLNKSIGKRWPEDFYQSIRNDDKQVIVYGQPIINKQEPAFLSTDGKVIMQTSTKIPIPAATGEIIGLFGISLDVSDTSNPSQLYRLYHKLHKSKSEAHENFLKHVLKADIKDHLYELTIGEMNCILQFVFGKTVKEVARSLDLSPRTIETHIARAKEKMGYTTKSEMAQALTNRVLFRHNADEW